MQSGEQVYILYFTGEGERLAERVRIGIGGEAAVSADCGKGVLKSWTQKHFRKGNVLLYIGACGIAVRAVAPYIQAKDTDPAVIVMDEKGKCVIPILSGHLGGANAWAEKIAGITGGQAVLTTATDVNGLFAADVFACANNLLIDDLKKAGRFAAGLLSEREARVIIPGKYRNEILTEEGIPPELTLEYTGDGIPEDMHDGNVVLLSPDTACAGGAVPLQLVPRITVIGMGCRRGKTFDELLAFAEETLCELGLRRESVCAVASADVKKEEAGLQSLAGAFGVPFMTFSARQLEETRLAGWEFAESDRVRAAVGTGNVCERAAAAAGAQRILLGKKAKNGMTICVGLRRTELRWGAAADPDAEPAKPEKEAGGLFVVGIGPGSREGMTEQAVKALEASDTIVGYSVYNELVKPWFPEKRYLTTPMTGEEDRCRMALEEAAAGHTVSLICSGDPGVYGMAGLVLETAERGDGAFRDVQIEIVSGVTAALSGAALLGAPLVHDFAVISLSDRLTPWELIEKRLRCAAEADLCIVLYNPSSRGRREHLHKAVRILMETLPGSRICGIADRIGREGEKTRVMTLEELAEAETDMFSTVFVGNGSTRRLGNTMVTPRGYRAEKSRRKREV